MVETPRAELSLGMQRINGAYTQGLRRKGSSFEAVVAHMVLGTARYMKKQQGMAETKRDVREHPRFQRSAARPPIEKIVGQRNAIVRAVLAKQVREAPTVHGYTLAEIANHLGVHYATAGRLLNLANDDAKWGC